MSQTTISAGGMSIGFAGQLADDSDPLIDSGFNLDTAQMPFGFGVRFGATGTAERMYSLPTGFSGTVQVEGVVLHGYDHAPQGALLADGTRAGDLGASGLVQYAAFDLLRRGRVLVPVEAAVAVGDRAWCRGIGTGAMTPGIWRGAAAGAAGPLGASYHIDCTKAAVFRTASSTAADGTTLVAVLEVDFVNR